jgi:C-terminal processing protease CtpA/Prc
VYGTFGPEPPTPASEAGLRRGEVIVAVDGASLEDDTLDAALERLGPSVNGVARVLTIEDAR